MPRYRIREVMVPDGRREPAWSIPYCTWKFGTWKFGTWKFRTWKFAPFPGRNAVCKAMQCRFAAMVTPNLAAVNFQAEPLSRYDRSRRRPDRYGRKCLGVARQAAVHARFVPRLRKFMPRLGIVPRLTLIGVLSIFAAVAVAIWASVKITEGEMYRRAQINLSINLKLLDSILSGYGAPSRKGDELYFGSTLINGNFEPVDRVKAVAGGTATVFLGDQRVTTNVMKPDGSRAVGTKLAPGAAYDSVFNQHQTYRGEANILGETYLTIYEPIVSGGNVLGIAYVGVKKAEFFDVLQSLVMTNLELGAGTVLFGGLIMFVLVRRVFAPIGAIRRELVAMAETTTQQGLDARTLATLDNLLDELRRTLYGRGEPRREGNTLLFGDAPRQQRPGAGRRHRRAKRHAGHGFHGRRARHHERTRGGWIARHRHQACGRSGP